MADGTTHRTSATTNAILVLVIMVHVPLNFGRSESQRLRGNRSAEILKRPSSGRSNLSPDRPEVMRLR